MRTVTILTLVAIALGMTSGTENKNRNLRQMASAEEYSTPSQQDKSRNLRQSYSDYINKSHNLAIRRYEDISSKKSLRGGN